VLRPPSPPARDQELQDNRELSPPSIPAQVLELQGTKGKKLTSPPAKEKELHHTTGKRPPPPPTQDIHLHPSTKQPELLPSTNRAPSTQQSVYVTAKDSSSSGFFFFEQKVWNIDKNACRQMFQTLEPFRKEVVVDERIKHDAIVVSKFFSCYKNYQHKEL
jgi:hypothetical protein